MKFYHSTSYMLEEMSKNGWIKEDISRGYILSPEINVGQGHIIVWGDSKKLCLINSQYTLSSPLYVCNYCKERGIQMTFIENVEAEFYKDKDDIQKSMFGTFFSVNNICTYWFKNYPANKELSATMLLITESFLVENGISLTDEQWNNLARAINLKTVSMPSIAYIIEQILTATVSDENFALYFKTKALEAFVLLYEYTIHSEQSSTRKIFPKSNKAIKKALHILDKEYISPPTIVALAKMVDIDKKTLLYAFKEIVGLSIHDYIKTLKMQKAVLLLKEENLKIDYIAKAVGYQSKIHFYNAFKETFNCTPSQMRKYM